MAKVISSENKYWTSLKESRKGKRNIKGMKVRKDLKSDSQVRKGMATGNVGNKNKIGNEKEKWGQGQGQGMVR